MGKVIKLDQRVEIIAQDVEELKNSGGGGSPSDSYTKAETNALLSKKADLDNEGLIPTSQIPPEVVRMYDNYFVVNGIRVYVSSTAPTGNIPDGSIGVGW